MSTSILWLGRIIPVPLNAGDRVYSSQLAAAIAGHGARVAFFGLQNPDERDGRTDDLAEGVEWRAVPGAPASRLRSVLSRLPMVGARFATANYRAMIARALRDEDFDVVVLDQYAMSWAVDTVRSLARNRPLMVHIAHNFETALNEQIARSYSGDPVRRRLLRENARKTHRAERHLAQACDLLVTLTEEDRKSFEALDPGLDCVVIPPGHAGVRQPDRTIGDETPRRAIIVGSFRWIAKQINLQRLLEAADPVFAQHGIELHIIGFVPEPMRRRLQASFPRVVFRGFVDDLGEECRKARIALIPEEVGGGFKLKTLDYVFAGVPVASVEAALSGIPQQLRSQFIVAPDIGALVGSVARTIDDLDRLNHMQQRAFALADALFDWDRNGARFLGAIRSVAARLTARDEPLGAGRQASPLVGTNTPVR